MPDPQRSQDAGFLDDSTLPLLAAFALALAFLGGVVALLSGGGNNAPAQAAATTTTTTVTAANDPQTTAPRSEFERVTLTVTTAGDGRGTVRIAGGPARACGDGCAATYEEGVSVRLVAREAAGSRFVGWTGTCDSHRWCTLTLDESTSATALFALAKQDLESECQDGIDNDDDSFADDEDPECAIGDTEFATEPIAPPPPPPAATPPPVAPPPVVAPPPPPPPVVPPPPPPIDTDPEPIP